MISETGQSATSAYGYLGRIEKLVPYLMPADDQHETRLHIWELES
jgi:hypothetical protein